MSRAHHQIKELFSLLNYLKLVSLFFVIPFTGYNQTQFTQLQIINPQETPLVGATISSGDLAFASVTDIDGRINIPINIEALLKIEYLGYIDKEFYLDEYKSGDIIILQPTEFIIDELTIVGRTNVRKDHLPYQIETIDQKKIKLTQPQTSADALAAHANVFVQKSQGGGGSPVLRGFEANKILLVVDGVRLNNAIYRSGHLQNAITVDPAMLQRMEVIYGAGSLTYGSDALGGVVHFRSRNPQLNFGKGKLSLNHNYNMRYANANFERSLHYDLNIGGKSWASLSSVSYSNFDDLQSGVWRNSKYLDFGTRPTYVERINGLDSIVVNPSPYKQVGSAYSQIDFTQKLLFQINQSTNVILNGQFSTSSDIPRYDMLSETTKDSLLKFAQWAYGPQNRLLFSGQINIEDDRKLFDQFKMIASYQNIDEDRFTRLYRSPIRNEQYEDVSVYGLTLDWLKNLGDSDQKSIRYGVDIQHNQVSSSASDINLETLSTDNNALTRYPSDGSTMQSYGIYSQYTWKSESEKLISNTGLRYNISRLNVRYESDDPFAWPQEFISGLSSNNSSIVASTGLNFKLNRSWRGHAQIANAYRAPNVDDVAKIRVKIGEVQVPNLRLQPEKSINGEIGLTRIINSRAHVALNTFYTRLKDAIVRAPFAAPDGSVELINNGDTLATVANVNATNGFVYGFSLNGVCGIAKGLDLKASLNYTKGRAQNDGEVEKPLAHIPPLFGQFALSYQYRDLDISAIFKYNGQKDLADFGGSEDNPEQATPIGSLAWQTYNLYVSYPYNKFLKLNVGIENIFDVHYRVFSSGISAPGRNFIVSIGGNF